MPACAIEVNDAGLVALREGAARPEPESPGLALLDGGALRVGAEAAARAWLQPRFVNDGFWDRLDTQPAGRPYPDEVTRADLAHAQLAALHEAVGRHASEAFLAVPGAYDTAWLGLLLGVARAAGLPVVGLVDAAVAAAALGQPGSTLLHVDVTRHRSVVTELVQGDEVVRTRVEAQDRFGWKGFAEAWAQGVAAQFVRETRFDPLHVAETEQALHDALAGWLAELQVRETLEATLEHRGRRHRVELARERFVAWAEELYRSLVQQVSLLKRLGEPTTLLLSPRAARLPGFATRLGEIRGVRVVELPVGAAVSGALVHRERIRHEGESLPFVTRLPSGLSEVERAQASAGAADAARETDPARANARGKGSGSDAVELRPTHLLYDGVAHRIDAEGLALGTAPPEGARALTLRRETTGLSRHHCTLIAADGEVVLEDHSSWGSFVNGERVVDRALLRAGDRLRLGSPGVELLLIAVEE